MQKLGLKFHMMSNPKWFSEDPHFAWGFFGHRYNLYSKTLPHLGYHIMLNLAKKKKYGYFVYTSNVDGHWSKVGVPDNKLTECHGSIHYLQCTKECSFDIWPATNNFTNIDVNEKTFRASNPLPMCKNCNNLARPNILMFDDSSWIWKRNETQYNEFLKWKRNLKLQDNIKLVVIEVGAGKDIPTIRNLSENIVQDFKGSLVRINLRDFDVPNGEYLF